MKAQNVISDSASPKFVVLQTSDGFFDHTIAASPPRTGDVTRMGTVRWSDRFAWVKHRKAEGKMGEALKELSKLAARLPEDETSLKVKCLLKVRRRFPL